MLIDNVKTTTIDSAITMREDRRGDWSEIAIYVSRANSSWSDKTCAAVITHPCKGARWFCIYDGLHTTAFRTRKEALVFSLSVARNLPDYIKAMEERRANQH
jgi:hypothetical protein